MNRFIQFFICSIFLLDFFHAKLHLIPRQATWIPDLLAFLCVIIIIAQITIKKKICLDFKYVLLFLLFFLHIIAGICLNMVPSGAVFAGMRTYFRFIPLFLLPCVYDFSDEEIKSQLRLLLILAIIQCPIAIYQRLFQFKGVLSGDVVAGTLNISSILSIFQVCSISILLAFYLRKRISFPNLVLYVFIIFIPTTINETKGTLFLLPIAILVCVVFSHNKDIKLSQYFWVILLLISLIGVFVPIYDHFIKPRWGYGIIDFFQMENRVQKYFYKGKTRPMGENEVGRIDSIVLAFDRLSDDPVKLMFGLGMGNVSHSFLKGFDGKYVEYQDWGAGNLALSNLLWEIGLFGVIGCLALYIFIFNDAYVLRKISNISGAFALGFLSIITIWIISLGYKNLLHQNISFLFWYFCGYICSKKMTLKTALR